MIEEIKGLYSQIDNKNRFLKMAAKKLGKSHRTLRVHWLSEGDMPVQHQEEFKNFLEETIKVQDRYKQELEKL